jgi:hypothetical protein
LHRAAIATKIDSIKHKMREVLDDGMPKVLFVFIDFLDNFDLSENETFELN